MTATFRALAVLAALSVAACGNGTEADGDQRSGADTTSTIVDDERLVDERPVPTSDAPLASEPTEAPTPAHAEPGSGSAPAVDDAGANAGDDTTASVASVYVPPAGRYVYDATGHVETTGLTRTREPVPPTSTDQVDLTDGPAGMRMTVTTREEGRESSQEVVVSVTDTEARLVRLTYRPSASGPGYAVNPDPPALLARLPYRVGDSWEIAWTDPATGISGVGTGSVTGEERVTTPAGSFDTVIITVTQRLRGTIEGTLTVTSWIDRATGVQAKQHIVTDFRDATGASSTDTTRVLREFGT